MLQTVSYRKFQ